METKICSKCKGKKDVCNFNKSSRNKNGLRGECKECQIKYYLNNNETLKKRRKERYFENTVKELNRNKIYYDKNKTDIIEKLKIKRQTNHTFRLKNNIRSRIIQFLNSYNLHKDNKTFDIIGCSPEFLKEYLEQKFTEGMSWDLMGKHIHIDHIVPLSSANTEEEVYKLCHYTNLQPLWAADNLKKGSKIL
jgi:RecJ-like exonuclease